MRGWMRKFAIIAAPFAVPLVGLLSNFILDDTLYCALMGGIACGALLGWRSEDIFNSSVFGAIIGAIGGLLFLGVLFSLGFWGFLVDMDMDLQMAVVAVAAAGSAVSAAVIFVASKFLAGKTV